MTAPGYYPPPKSLDGRSARELMSYERTVDDGDETLPPVIARERAKESLTIYAEAGALRLVRQPAAATLYHLFNVTRLDATPYTHVRLCGHRKAVGASGATLYVVYTDDPTDLTTLVSAGDGVPAALPMNELGPYAEGLVPIVEDARADVYWGVLAVGGDGVLSPEVNNVEIQFDTAVEPARERWYWRTGTPAVNPIDDSPTGDVDQETLVPNLIGNPSAFWGCGGPPPLEDWLTVSHDPATLPQVLLRTKGNSEVGLSTTSPNGHWNVSGAIGRFVGPPLAAQNIPAFAYAVGFSGIAYSGSVAGHAAVRLSLWRPGVGFIESGNGAFYGALWFRYIPKAHVTTVVLGALTAEAGDRFVLDVSADVEIGCAGGFVTEGLGVTVNFNGSNDSFVDFGDAPGSTASWLELPRLIYTSETP